MSAQERRADGVPLAPTARVSDLNYRRFVVRTRRLLAGAGVCVLTLMVSWPAVALVGRGGDNARHACYDAIDASTVEPRFENPPARLYCRPAGGEWVLVADWTTFTLATSVLGLGLLTSALVLGQRERRRATR